MSEQISNWIFNLDLKPTSDGWTIAITLSTAPVENWFYKRNKLKPEDLKLTLTIPSRGNWIVELNRHDQLFQVQWRPDNDTRVESQQMKYKRLIKWPALGNLNDFPDVVAEIENVLNVKFIKHANIGARFFDLKELTSTDGKVKAWLNPCADSIGEFMQS